MSDFKNKKGCVTAFPADHIPNFLEGSNLFVENNYWVNYSTQY